MSGFYKIGHWSVSDALLPIETFLTEYKLRSPDGNILAVKNLTGQQMSFPGSGIMAYAHDGLEYEVEKKVGSEIEVHFVVTPSIETGLIFKRAGANSENNMNSILRDLTGLEIETQDGVGFEVNVDPVGHYVTFLIQDEPEIRIYFDDQGYTVNGEDSDLSVPMRIGSVSIVGDIDMTNANIMKSRQVVNVEPSNLPIDAGYNRYTTIVNGLDLSLDNSVELEVMYDDGLVFDDFGSGYKKITGSNIYVSNLGSFFIEDGDKTYRDVDKHTYIEIDGFEFMEYNTSLISSSLNSSDYEYDLVHSTEKIYIGYLRVYSSYILIDYYFSKKDTSTDECATIADTATATRAIRLKVYDGNIVSQYPHADIENIGVNNLTAEEISDAFQKLQYGAGSFKSPYKIYYYRDYVDRIKVIFNRENSGKYWTLEVFDQSTRWKAVLSQKNGTVENVVATKYLARYDLRGLWGIYPVTSPYVLMNMKTKRAYDNVADTAETSFRNDAIELEAKTIKLFTRVIYMNIANYAVSFPQIRLSFSTLALIELSGYNTEIVFQQASGAIYGRYKEGTDFVYIESENMIAMMNDIDPNYQFAITCNISKLKYYDENGTEQNIPFSDSTLIAAEKIATSSGQKFRIYYKNVTDDGFVIANSYSIEE